jgi:hypothetical protein
MDWNLDWNLDTLKVLTNLVDDRYDSEFRHSLESWLEHLEAMGIERLYGSAVFQQRAAQKTVWIECPYSIRNSPIGSTRKAHIHIPIDLAEKIVVLGSMP